MSNPLNNEKAVYQKIIKEKLAIPSVIWQLLDHHLRNDLNVITLIVGYYIAGNAQESIPPGEGKKIIERCEEISQFLKKLKDATDRQKAH